MESGDEEIKLLYLLSGSCDAVPSSCARLRSYLNLHLSTVVDQQNLKLLKSFRNRNKTCPYCYSPWNGDTTFKLLPSKRSKAHHKGRKISGKGESDKPINDLRNTLVLKCKVCTKKSQFSLIKKKPIEEKEKEGNVEIGKRRKKKKDMTCGLAVNVLKSETPEVLILKKKKRAEHIEENKAASLVSCHSESTLQNNLPTSKRIPKPVKEKKNKLVLNPFATQRLSMKANKKLQRLKEAVKEDKGSAKKTLKDFLTLV